MLTDIAIGCINILGWGLKPLIEKKSCRTLFQFHFCQYTLYNNRFYKYFYFSSSES